MNARDRRTAKRHAFRQGLKAARRWWGWCLHQKTAADLFAKVPPKDRGNPWAKSRFNLRMGVKAPLYIVQADAFDAGWESFKP